MCAAIASLGPTLHVRGRSLMPLPWAGVEGVPLLNNAIPDRFTMYAWLGIAIVAAMWVAGPSRWSWRWGLIVLAVVVIAPVPSRSPPREAEVPAFFREGLYESHLHEGDHVLIIPWGKAGLARDMLWQAATDMHFKLMGGHVGFVPLHYQREVVLLLRYGRPELIHPGALAGFISFHDVAAVIVDTDEAETWRGLLSTLGVSPVAVGGVLLYPVGSSS